MSCKKYPGSIGNAGGAGEGNRLRILLARCALAGVTESFVSHPHSSLPWHPPVKGEGIRKQAHNPSPLAGEEGAHFDKGEVGR